MINVHAKTKQSCTTSLSGQEQLRVLLLPPGRDASPSITEFTPPICRRYPFIHLGDGTRGETIRRKISCQRKQHRNEKTNQASNQRPSDVTTVRSKVRRANHSTVAPLCEQQGFLKSSNSSEH